MEFTMTITTQQPLTEDQADDILCQFGDDFDAASVGERSLVVDGTVRQRVRLAYIMLGIRRILRWRPVEFAVEFATA